MSKSPIREIPNKNYITAGMVILFSIVLIIYVAKWYAVYQEDNLNKAIISDYLNEVSYEEFPNYLIENIEAIVYVGIANNNDCRAYENIFKNIIDNYELQDKIIYLNITDFSQTNIHYITQINEDFGSEKAVLLRVPALIIFDKGKITAVLDKDIDKTKTIKFLKKQEIIN